MSHDPIFFTPYQSARFGQARTLYKGGGDPGDGGAAAREADRQARIQAGTDQVNAIFGIGGQKTQVPTGQRNLTGYTRTYTTPVKSDGSEVGMIGGEKVTESITPEQYAALQNKPADEYVNPYASLLSGGGDAGIYGTQKQAAVTPDQYTANYQDVMTEVDSPANLAAQQRQAMYDGLKEDTRKFYSSQLGEDRSKAQRELGFQKARQGIIGSSQANDMDTQFQAANDRGLLDVANRADSAATQFRTADEQARLNLITKVVAGLDQGTAAQNAASTLQTNQNAAKENYQSQRMGNVFADLLGTYNQGQYMAGTNAAKTQGTNQYGNWFANDKAVTGEIT